MIQKILLLLFCSLFFQTAEAQLFLSEAIAVSEEGTGARAPRVALLENDNPVVYWGKQGSNPQLYIAQWNDDSFGESLIDLLPFNQRKSPLKNSKDRQREKLLYLVVGRFCF